MIKIVCMIQPNPAQVYFLNRVSEKYKILAIVESPVQRAGLMDKIKAKGLAGSVEDIINRLLKGSNRQRQKMDDYNRNFGDRWKTVDPSIPVFATADINSSAVEEFFNKEKPALIVDHGTSLVKNHILATAPLALNLHWGLSPYYRGAYCTEWALVNWDPFNIGVTIHKLSKEIDGGDVLAQARAVISSTDTAHSINMQLTKLGAELVVKIIERLETGQPLQFKKQDYSQGFMTTIKQSGRHLFKEVQRIEDNGLLKTILERPCRRQALPIVEL